MQRLVLLAASLAAVNGQTCQVSTQLTKAPGTIRDRNPQSGNYASGVDCHWQIKTPKTNTIVTLTFSLLNLNAWQAATNDIILVNLGVNAPMPLGWDLYTRSIDLSGEDDIGYFDYVNDPQAVATCVAEQQGQFDPTVCDLVDGSLLTDTARSSWWYYFIGSGSGASLTMMSTAQDVYVIFRSFAKSVSPPSTPTYGFAATYSFDSAFCNGLTVLAPLLAVATGANATTTQIFKDNMVGANKPNMACSWLIQPTRADGAIAKLFDSIWLSFSAVNLSNGAQVTMYSTFNDPPLHLRSYDGASASGTVLLQISGGRPAPTSSAVTNNQGSMFVTYATNNAASTPGFTINWQAAYCPKGCSGSHGSCVAGGCICKHGWAGAACDTPEGWLCDSMHYNSSDGCDCGCGIYGFQCSILPHPDCTGLFSLDIVGCTTSPSFTNTAFNPNIGMLPTGTCIYCPLPHAIPSQLALPNTIWNETDGSIVRTCPQVHQCGPGSQCDYYGECVRVTNSSADILRKACRSVADCPAATVCNIHGFCEASTNFGLLFADASLVATRCQLLGMNITAGFTIEMTLQVTSRNATDVILSYPGLSLAQSSALVITVGNDAWSTSVSINDGLWYSVVVTWRSVDAATSIYVYNSTTKSSHVVASTHLATTGVSLVPAMPLNVGGFNGSMAFLRIWNQVRDASAYFQPSQTNDSSILVAEYRFMDGSARDLSTHQNDLLLSAIGVNPLLPGTKFTFAFGASPGGTPTYLIKLRRSITLVYNPCLVSPVPLEDAFPTGSTLLVSAVLSGGNWTLGFYDSSEYPVLEVAPGSPETVQIAIDGMVAATLAMATAMTADAILDLRFERMTTASMKVCLSDTVCTETTLNPNDDFASFMTNTEGNEGALEPVCVSKAGSLAALATLVSPVIKTTSGETCTFPMAFSQRDCTAFTSYLTSKGISNTTGVSAAQTYAYTTLDLSTQPCTCTTMPSWLVQAKVMRVDSTAGTVTTQIQYTTIKTKKTTDSTTVYCVLSKSQCVITGADANQNLVMYDALRCVTMAESTLDRPTELPWCLVSGRQEVCMGEQNPCGLHGGSMLLTSLSGSVSDGYVTTCTAGVHTCYFTITPTVPTVLQPYARVQLTVQQLQLSPSDQVLTMDCLTNASLGSTLSGGSDWA
ncbi:hypothetical protein ACHHYP_10694 [Achlya hypogyna]|uniref:CUB domain-containing protein n=1 Tax=Achlya hypogyna TaxID=1202772 RepID=A0A1V9YKP8_ACHHY|nr:hypothetical protein ACHHYP_10694 [Achlya hypogyna]